MEKIIVSNNTVEGIVKGLDEVKRLGVKFPIKVWYAFNRTRNKLNRIVKDFADTKDDLINRYAKKNDKGEKIYERGGIVLENANSYVEELQILADDLREIEIFTINSEEIGMDFELEGFDNIYFVLDYLIVWPQPDGYMGTKLSDEAVADVAEKKKQAIEKTKKIEERETENETEDTSSPSENGEVKIIEKKTEKTE